MRTRPTTSRVRGKSNIRFPKKETTCTFRTLKKQIRILGSQKGRVTAARGTRARDTRTNQPPLCRRCPCGAPRPDFEACRAPTPGRLSHIFASVDPPEDVFLAAPRL